jgi:hypothetical protein
LHFIYIDSGAYEGIDIFKNINFEVFQTVKSEVCNSPDKSDMMPLPLNILNGCAIELKII